MPPVPDNAPVVPAVPVTVPELTNSAYCILASFLPKMPPAPPASAFTSPSFFMTIILSLSPTLPLSLVVILAFLVFRPATPPT